MSPFFQPFFQRLVGRNLHDTSPEPLSRAYAPQEAAPAGVATADISASPPQRGLPGLSRDGTPEGSLHAFALRTCCGDRGLLRDSPCGQGSPVGAYPLSNPLQVGISFFPHPKPAVPWASLARRFPERKEVAPPFLLGDNGFPLFIFFTAAGVRWRLSAGGASSAPEER
jgi:hypothetical protein